MTTFRIVLDVDLGELIVCHGNIFPTINYFLSEIEEQFEFTFRVIFVMLGNFILI